MELVLEARHVARINSVPLPLHRSVWPITRVSAEAESGVTISGVSEHELWFMLGDKRSDPIFQPETSLSIYQPISWNSISSPVKVKTGR